jgi:branched-chain amino acid transport system permease protein
VDLRQRWLPAPQRVRDWDGATALPARDKPARGELLLDVEAVRKEFGGLVAVNDVSFQIRAGDIVGLIGPNGAGKSTTFNLITGVLPLTKRRGALPRPAGGRLPSRQIARRGMSRTFQHVKMIPEMTVLENVALGGYLRSTPAREGHAAAGPRRGAPPVRRGRTPAAAHRHGRARCTSWPATWRWARSG